MIKKRTGQIRTERRHRNTSTTSIAQQKFHLHAILDPPPHFKLNSTFSCLAVPSSGILRFVPIITTGKRVLKFGGGGGLAAGGDGWLFSAMFAQCIAVAADGRGGDRPPQMKRDTR